MRHTEVNQVNDWAFATSEIARANNDVLCLDIAMHEALIMENFEVVYKLLSNLYHSFKRESVSWHSPKQISKVVSQFFHN